MFFDWLDMLGTYDARKVDNTECNGFTIDTAKVTDRDQPYETAINNSKYAHGCWIIVGWADTLEEAQELHDKTVEFYSQNEPEFIEDAYDHIMYYKEES